MTHASRILEQGGDNPLYISHRSLLPLVLKLSNAGPANLIRNAEARKHSLVLAHAGEDIDFRDGDVHAAM